MKSRNAKLKRLAAAATALFVFFPAAALAYKLLEPLPGGQGGVIKEVTSLTDYLSWIFRFTLAAAAFLAVMQIVIGAMHIIVGGASEAARTKGRGMIEMALWGLLLAVSSVLILETINPDLVRTSLDIPPTGNIESATGTGGGNSGGKIDCTNPPKIENQCVPGNGDCAQGYECAKTTETQCEYAVWKCAAQGG